MQPEPLWGLPDPETQFGFYDGVIRKRLVAWLIDTVLITGLVALAIPFTAFVGLFFLPVLWLMVSFVYRTATLTNSGATWGMQFMGIELRTHEGQSPDGPISALHSAAYLGMTMVFPAQMISILLMLTSERGQGLHDMVLGTAMVNRAA